MVTERKKILVVDSDADLLVAVERMLEDAGFDTTTTRDVQQAKMLLASDAFDLVLVGEQPFGVSSATILETLWSKERLIPCIVFLRFPGTHGVMSKWNLRHVLGEVQYCFRASGEDEHAEPRRTSAA